MKGLGIVLHPTFHRNKKVVTYLVDGICAKNRVSGRLIPQVCVLNRILNRQFISDVTLSDASDLKWAVCLHFQFRVV